MNIAVVGGGSRCIRLMEVIQRHEFQEIQPKIVAVSDINANAPGITQARQQGLFTTQDYNDILKIKDIDLIIELTGDMDLYNHILERKSKSVRAISYHTVQLFWEISRISTLHKKTSQELHEARAICKMIMDELIQEDVMVISYNYRILDINQSLLNKLGLKRQDVIGRNCYEITHRSDIPCSGDHHPCPLVKTLEMAQPYQTTHIHLDKDNNERHFSISTYPMIEGGDVIGAIEISRDITRDINMQKSLMQQEKLASIGRLSAGVAHEINNPLTTILTSAMLIQEDLDPQDPAYKELDIIANETLRCRKIVTSLLDFARQTKPEKKFNDLNKLVTKTVLLTKKQAAFKDIRMQFDLDDAVPQIMMDKGQIEQVLINLILNAVEATPSGGCITVSTAHEPKKESARIDIRDTGTGITKENLDNIFDPFFTTKESGTGLGLAIAHGIIEQHGGSIEVENLPEQGACFSIRLPAKKGTDNDTPIGTYPHSG